MSRAAKRAKVEDPKNDVFIVEKVLDKRSGKAGREEFLIQWQGFPETDSTWEPRENLECSGMLEDFEKEYAKREKPTRRRKSTTTSAPTTATTTESSSPAVEEEEATNPNDKYKLNGKQLRCIIGLTKGPGELHFLCKFSDDTARLVPAKEVNSRYRPFVDEYGKFLRRRFDKCQKEGKKKGSEENEEDLWPEMPEGYRILSTEEHDRNIIEESQISQQHMDEMETPTAHDILHDMQMAANGDMLSSFPQDLIAESLEPQSVSDPILSVFDDRSDSPFACPIVVDTVLEDDDSIFFPPNS